MLTLYQLKQNSCFRFFYKWPYTMKNMFLLVLQLLLLILIYLIFFRADGGSLQGALKILKGLNSNTFNYLDLHRDELQVDRKIPTFSVDPNDAQSVNTVKFFSQCVRLNKPCLLDRLATNWRAMEYWKTGAGPTNDRGEEIGVEYLKKLIGENTEMTYYYQPPGHLKEAHTKNEVHSFPGNGKFKKQYKFILNDIEKQEFPGEIVVKESSTGQSGEGADMLHSKLLNDIVIPAFYHDVAELEGVELYQGSVLFDRPHYIKKEQLLCVVEGFMDIALIPHVNRQEVYAGQNIKGGMYANGWYQHPEPEMDIATSPINFFAPKVKNYMNFRDAKKDSFTLDAGDCIFIPAYYFYQFMAFNIGQHNEANEIHNKYYGRAGYQSGGAGIGASPQTMAQLVSLQF